MYINQRIATQCRQEDFTLYYLLWTIFEKNTSLAKLNGNKIKVKRGESKIKNRTTCKK
jgi:hypothetical protein